ncbi:MAG: hypothetical protein R2764_01560 [Bacteroidales bacterium]
MLTLTLIIIAAVMNSVMDTLKFRFQGSIFNSKKLQRYLGPESWRNKWDTPLPPSRGEDRPKYRERFLFSSTILVFVTDGWHLAQFIMLKAMILAVVLYSPLVNWWADFLIYSITFSLIFEIFYSKIWQNKK